MCGIFCAINKDANPDWNCVPHSALAKLLHNRGPDAQLTLQLDNLLLAGNVLWHQGAAPQRQPISVGDCVLLFNGDLFNVDERKSDTVSDSAWLAQKLAQCSDDADILQLLREIEGPLCLVLYHKQKRALYFARDALGRNSLIIERHQHGLHLLSTSYFLEEDVISLELPPLGLYKLELDDLSKCVLYPWQPLNESAVEQLSTLEEALNWTGTVIKSSIAPNWLLSTAGSSTPYDFYEHCLGDDYEQIYQDLLQLPAVEKTLDTLHSLLQSSVAARVLHTAPVCRNCLAEAATEKCVHAKLCLLFSGGIDCSILALLADQFVPGSEPIELINVAFQSASSEESWNVPDRQTALQSLAELQRLRPNRRWQLLLENVTRLELQQQLSSRISQLIYPLQTVLDESIGCAFWFAAQAPKSTARVALLGSGADELFGGYIRHRNAYRRCHGDEEAKQQAVREELQLDWQRLPARNLARDDRVIADSGKTARAPFIEEHFVKFVRSLAPQQRCCFQLPEGVGDKLLLRLYGRRLGLREATQLKKRAIQFGSRIADKKQRAQDQSTHLQFQRINS